MVNQAAQQPQTTQQPQQPTNQVPGLTPVNVNLDDESLKIIQTSSGVFAEAIINLGIKLVSKTNVYKEFMIKDEFKKATETETEDIETAISVSEVSNTTTSSNTTMSNTTNAPQPASAPATPSGGFSSW